MLIRNILFLLAFISLTTSCGKEAVDIVPDDRVSDDLNPDNGPNLSEIAKNFSLTCDQNGDACPEYVVQVLSRQRSDEPARVCTGVLIDSQTILTSALCIPNFLTVQSRCGRDVHVVFQDSTGQKSIACREIKALSPTSRTADPASWERDYALFDLREEVSGLTPIDGNLEGLKHQQRAGLWYVLEETQDKSVVSLKSDCHVVHNSFVQPFATNHLAPVMALTHCDVPSSAAGGVIIDNQLQPKALYSTALAQDWVDLILNQLPFSGQTDVPHFSYIFSYNCIPFLNGVSDEKRRPGCSVNISKGTLRTARNNMMSASDSVVEIQQYIRDRLGDENKYLAWGVSFHAMDDQGVIETTIRPRCFKNHRSWINEFRSGTWPFRSYDKSAVRDHSWPEFSIDVSFNHNLQVEGVLTEGRYTRYAFRFSPRQLDDGRFSFIDLYYNDDQRPSDRFEQIWVCQ